MTKIIKLSITALLICTSAFADDLERDRISSVRKAIQNISEIEKEEATVVGGLKRMFKYSKISGEVRSIYSVYNNKDATDAYATAIGTQLKYELAEFKGFNAGIALSLSRDINSLTGDNLQHNNELSSSDGSYAQLSEAYINYRYENFNFRVGRQLIDTPLADSDDARMIPNTFEAYIASYELDKFSFIAGLLKEWQGVDAGLDTNEPWQSTGEDGTYFGGITYNGDILEANAWYYDISASDITNSATENFANKSSYIEIFSHYHINDDIVLHSGAQYLNQKEKSNSGIESNIYGLSAELVAYDIGFNLAYNKSTREKDKGSFSGFGGGTLFTSMDSMIIDAIATDRDAKAIVAGLSYSMGDFNFLYAYGDFKGDSDTLSQKEHIVEQDIAIEYTPNDNLTIASVYTINKDKENSDTNGGDWNNFRILVSYNFQMTLKKRKF